MNNKRTNAIPRNNVRESGWRKDLSLLVKMVNAGEIGGRTATNLLQKAGKRINDSNLSLILPED